MQFPGGVMASFDCSFRMTRRQHYEVVGPKGTISVPAAYVPGNEDVDIVLTVEGETEIITIAGTDQYRLEVEHFSDCILGGTSPRYTGEDGLRNMRVIDAIYRSGQEGRPVAIAGT
ncbi:MAG: hypothetical protein D6736_18875 [Nitrospinota bacterium]|nr:MAG: hypothetical protein D6736_18875 [Nitrospinota bacterium]